VPRSVRLECLGRSFCRNLSIIRLTYRKPRGLNDEFLSSPSRSGWRHLEETIWAILAQIVRPSVGGVAPDCYFTGLGLILSQNAHW